MLRAYGRDRLQTIGRPELIGPFNSPINNDDQLANAITEMLGVEDDIIAAWSSAYDEYATAGSELARTEVDAAIAAAGEQAGYAQFNTDPDPNGRIYARLIQRILIRTNQQYLYEQANP